MFVYAVCSLVRRATPAGNAGSQFLGINVRKHILDLHSLLVLLALRALPRAGTSLALEVVGGKAGLGNNGVL